MRYFPMFLDMRERRVVVVGGGEEALRKVRLLLKSEAIVTLVADRLHPELDGLVSHGAVAWLGTRFEAGMLDGAALVFVAADAALEAAVSTASQARGIPVNVVDRADLSTAITPAIIDRDPLVIAIGTEGAAPVLGQGIRQEIEAMLPPRLGALARRAVRLRARVAASFEAGAPRRDFWRRFFFGALRDSFLGRDPAAFEAALAAALDGSPKSRTGRVALVGAGPGDPELLTLKAQRKLNEADVIVHDRLVGPGILEYARRDADPHCGRQEARQALAHAGRHQPHPDREEAGKLRRPAEGRRSLMSSAAAARSRRRSRPPASRSRSCPASPRRWAVPPRSACH